MDHLLSTSEVAKWLNVPIETMRKWRKLRTGPVGFRVGRHVRYRREDVEDWLEERRDDRPQDAA